MYGKANTDIDRSIEAGVSINGKQWGRPEDTIGIAGVINGIAPVHAAWLNAGGLGIVVGDGQLPHPGLEDIIEAYYSYAITSSMKVSFDYQFVANPAYNTDRGPGIFLPGDFTPRFNPPDWNAPLTDLECLIFHNDFDHLR